MKQEKLHQLKRRGLEESTLSEKLFKLFTKQNKHCQFKKHTWQGRGAALKSGWTQGLFPQGQLQPPPSLFQDKQKTDHVRTQWEKNSPQAVREVLPEINPAGTLISDFSASRTIFHFFLMLFSGTQYGKMYMTGVFIDRRYLGGAFEIERSCSFTLKTQICSPLGTIRHLHWRPRIETTGPHVLYIL